MNEREREALRRKVDAERRRRSQPPGWPSRWGDHVGRSVVERCIDLEKDPLLALDLAVTASAAVQADRPRRKGTAS